MMIHDLIYIIYIFLTIFTTKSYLNKTNKSPQEKLNDSFELTMLSCNDQDNKAINDAKKNVNSENIREMVIEKESSWLRWIRILNLRFFFFKYK